MLKIGERIWWIFIVLVFLLVVLVICCINLGLKVFFCVKVWGNSV